jgi:DNA-binding MarR family transcriptional regulator
MKLESEIAQYNFRNIYHKAAINLIFTFNWLYNLQSEIFKPFNLTIQQFNILRILRGQYPKPATIKLLKERMLDKMSDASRIVEKLRAKGLVERQICSEDRRTVDVLISEKGLNLLANLDEKNDELDKILSHLNVEELKILNGLLDKLRG